MKIKLFESFNQIEIKEVDGINLSTINRLMLKGEWPNLDVDDIDFKVLVEFEGIEKLISIPFDIFINFIRDEDPRLDNYLKTSSVNSIDDVFNELIGFGWDFLNSLQLYVNKYYSDIDQIDDIYQDMDDIDSDIDEY